MNRIEWGTQKCYTLGIRLVKCSRKYDLFRAHLAVTPLIFLIRVNNLKIVLFRVKLLIFLETIDFLIRVS